MLGIFVISVLAPRLVNCYSTGNSSPTGYRVTSDSSLASYAYQELRNQGCDPEKSLNRIQKKYLEQLKYIGPKADVEKRPINAKFTWNPKYPNLLRSYLGFEKSSYVIEADCTRPGYVGSVKADWEVTARNDRDRAIKIVSTGAKYGMERHE